MREKDGVIILTKSETRIFWAIQEHGPVTTEQLHKLFPRGERPSITTIRYTCNELWKRKVIKRKGRPRKCQLLVYAANWQEFPDKQPLKMAAYIDPMGQNVRMVPRRSIFDHKENKHLLA